MKWLLDNTKPISETDLQQLERELAGPIESRGSQYMPRVAVCLHDMIIHNNKKWFGNANIRLDALVITGYGQENDPNSFYMPKTVSFPGVKDGAHLPIGEGGLIIFHGIASYFLDIFIMVSRDRKDTDNLVTLLTQHLNSEPVKDSLDSLQMLTGTAPGFSVVKTAMTGAIALGEAAYHLLSNVTGNTIGLYRNTHLQHRDGYGIGNHPKPPETRYLINDLSFRYEIILENDPYA